MKNSLVISNLFTSIENKEILHGVSLEVKPGEVHVIMGPNGSGKSTLAQSLLGHPTYLSKAEIFIGKDNISKLSTEDRAKFGLFLAFQSPIAIPGVSVMNLLRTSYDETHKQKVKKRFDVGGMAIADFTKMVKTYAKELSLEESFLSRSIHDGFSGGEKKKVEMLTALVLQPKFAVFDEIDTGLDVDALKAVATGINLLRQQATGVLIITHYQRILKYIPIDKVHILVKGNIVKTGDAQLVKQIEEAGYKSFL